MYEQFYGLREKPFSIVPNPDYLYLSQKHQNALVMLEYGLTEDAGFILLTGEIGAGKTTLIKYMLGKIDRDREIAVIFNTNVSPQQLIRQILQAFDLPPQGESKAEHLDTLYRFLIEKFSQRKKVLLIIDEAQNLPDESLEEVRMLNNLQTEEDMLLKVLIVGQPELQARLKNPFLTPLSQRIAVRFHLRGLTREEAGQYIIWRLKKAGGKTNLFTKAAVDVIYRHSRGIPRSINLLCNAALVYGFADDKKQISAQLVKQVIDDERDFNLREEDSKFQEGKKTADGSPAQSSDGGLLQRIESVEKGLKEVRGQLKVQRDAINQFTEKIRDEGSTNLKDILKAERKRNDELLMNYTRLKERYEVMQRYLKNGAGIRRSSRTGAQKIKKLFWK